MKQLVKFMPRFFIAAMLVILLSTSVAQAQSGPDDNPEPSIESISPTEPENVVEFNEPGANVHSLFPDGITGGSHSNLYWWTFNINGRRGMNRITICSDRLKSMTRKSSVFVSASEGKWSRRHMGSAVFTVHDVVPLNGCVVARVEINWHTNLPLALDLMWTKG